MKREIVAIVMLAGLAVNGWGAEFYVSPAAMAAWSGAVPAHLLAALCVAAFAAALYSRLAHGIGRQGRC